MPSTVFVTPNEQIALGYNNAAGLALVTSLTANSVSFFEVQGIARYRLGSPEISTIGTKFYAGYPSTAWVSGFITLEQYDYIRTTYIDVATRGKVTIKTLYKDASTYANFNAILQVGDLADYSDNLFWHTVYGKGINNFVWEFTRLEAL